MADVTLRYLYVKPDRHGEAKYFYFRHRDRLQRLPGEPMSEDFMDRYRELVRIAEGGAEEAVDPAGDLRKFSPGTFGALVLDYYEAAAFKQLKASTQVLYRRILDQLSAEHGPKRISKIRRRHIRKMRDARAETPGAANNVLRLLKLLLNFAVDEELIEVNPAARMKELEGGEYRSWTDAELTMFEDRWAPGTMERRAFAIALYTGQRKSDQVAMTRACRDGGAIQVVQEKTDEPVWIPEHPVLTAELALGAQHISLLVTSRGKSFDPVYYGAWFADAIDEAGLPDDCVLHGLRKCAARHLAEAGCTPHEIQAITGHKTLRMVEEYTKGASKKRGATAAIIKLQTRGRE